MALRPRTQQVVGIIDELFQQSNRDQTFTPRNPVPRPSYMPYDQGSAGSSMRTFNKALGMFNVEGSPTPLMPPSLRSQREPFRPSVNLDDTSAVAPGVPANAATGSLNVPQVGVRQQTPDEMALNMPRVPGSDMDIMAATQEAEARMRDLGGKAAQAALLEAKNPELKQDPTFQDRIKGFFGDRGNMLRMAIAFNSLRTTPDAALTQLLGSELQQMSKQQTSNRTAKAVAAQLRKMGFDDEAALVESNPSMAKDIYSSIITSRKPQSAIAKLNADLKANRITQEEYDIGIEALKKAGIQIDLGKKGDQAYLTTAMGDIAQKDMAAADAALSAVTSINKIDQTLGLLASGAPTTGMGAEFKQFVDRGLAVLGDRAAIERAADTQLLESLLGTDVFGAISALGIGARGLDTPAEREFLRSVLTGTTNMTAEAIEKVSNLRRKYAQKAIDFYNQKVERGDYDALNAQLGVERYKKIEIPEAPSRTKYNIGDTWTDQQTNVTYRFKGPQGMWMNRDNWEEVQ